MLFVHALNVSACLLDAHPSRNPVRGSLIYSLEQASILANQIGADQDLLARWLRSSSHEIMATSSRSSSGHAGFALFSTLGKNAAPGMAKNEDKRQTKKRAAQVALRHRRLAVSLSVSADIDTS